MRYRLMATYFGVPYHVGLGPDGNEATLFSPGPPPDELGFTPAGGHWRKQVSVTDLGALWQSRLVGEYRGEPCLVLDDLGDRLHIAYQGRDSARARQLGYWEIDREVFEVVVARQDVTGLTEERVEYPLDAAMFPASNRDPVAQPPSMTRLIEQSGVRTTPSAMATARLHFTFCQRCRELHWVARSSSTLHMAHTSRRASRSECGCRFCISARRSVRNMTGGSTRTGISSIAAASGASRKTRYLP